jgi:hypothetical protein
MMMTMPPIRLIQSRFWRSTWPSIVAPAPMARKISVKPSTKRRPWTSAARRACWTSSSERPVMNVT